MLSIEEARQKILSAIKPLPAETVPLSEAHGRILAAQVRVPLDLPPFDNSAMDGYAVRADDVKSATADAPVGLQMIGRVAAGETFLGTIGTGQCVRVFTGSALPAGADAVVMQEDTRVADDSTVLVLDAAKPWENVRFRGEDVKHGEVIAEAGSRISTGRLALLAALGVPSALVGRRPRVAILATGSELRSAGETLGPGQIFESNRVTLAALVKAGGAVPVMFPLVADDLAATGAALERALAECDAVLTSGGVSVGELDFVKEAWRRIGGSVDVWRVAMKPGKPFVFGERNDRWLFGVPGNPVSALVTFAVLVAPALRRLQGATDTAMPVSHGLLAEPLINRGDRRHFLRVKIDDAGLVRSAGRQGSHMLGSLADANGLVEVPAGSSLAAGEAVRVLRWE